MTSGGSAGQAGYHYQNLVAANHLLDLIELGSTTQSVTLDNPNAGPHIDDVIVQKNGANEFIQVKWSGDDSQTLTLAGLVSAEPTTTGVPTSLLHKLARGYLHASTALDRPIVVTLQSTWKPSKRRQGKWNNTLAEFLGLFHKPFLERTDWALVTQHDEYSRFASDLTLLQEATEILDTAEFSTFVRTLRFRLGEPGIETVRDRLNSRLIGLGIESQKLALLVDAAVRWSISREDVVAKDVLRELDLLTSFHDSLAHSFPVDESGWVPRPELFSALDDSLGKVSSGVILIEGEAGSGKSTAVTKYLADRPDVLFGYYCFVPEDHALGNDRVSQDGFVRSLCHGLRTSFPDVDLPTPYAPPTLRLLNVWLAKLSAERQRVVIILDGLDHVTRKKQEGGVVEPLTPILDGIPPTGVTFIVTSRNLEALPPTSRLQVKSEPGRRLNLVPFTVDEVDTFLLKRGLQLDPDELDLFARVSAGLPMYMEVLSRQIESLSTNDRKRLLAESAPIEGFGIDRFHDALWVEISNDPVGLKLLAVLARQDEFTGVTTLCGIVGNMGPSVERELIDATLVKFKHVLRWADFGAVAILHSSLSEYLRRQTVDLNQVAADALLSFYQSDPGSDIAWRHLVRNLSAAERHSEILYLCTGAWLEEAWAAYRPVDEIDRILCIALESAERIVAIDEFVRLVLLRQRLTLLKRNLDFDQLDEAVLLLDFDLSEQALRRLWNGQFRTCSTFDFSSFVLEYRK
jgi:Cap4 dsDNA endonuclease/NACHT domain